jgi:1,2-diacylglycerol 3-beta-galactosyltransferase
MTKRILILTADAGFGHRSAANAILAALHERYDDVFAEVVNPLARPDAPGLLKFAESDYDREVQQSPELYNLGYQASDGDVAIGLMEQGLIAMLYKPLRALLEEARPDAIVSTYPLFQAPLAAVFALSGRHLPLLVVVTDLSTVHGLWFHDGGDLCLAPTEQVRRKAVASGLPPDRVVITGLPVSPRFAQPYDKQALRPVWAGERIASLPSLRAASA